MLIQADGFALYGTGATARTNMAKGVYAQIDSPITVESTNPRGFGTHHLHMPSTMQGDELRRVLGDDYGDGLGFGAAYYLSQLPSASTSHVLLQGRNDTNQEQYSLTVSTTGLLQLRRGDQEGTVVAATDSPVIVAGAYQHVEVYVVCHASAGSIEIRVAGETVLSADALNTQGGSDNAVTQWAMGCPKELAGWAGTMDVADVVVWDTTGSVVNDFIGDTQCLVWYPTADTASDDWAPNVTGSGYTQIDDAAGPDDDTSYVEAPIASPGAISEYDVTNLPSTTSDVIAVITQPMLRKTDAGDGSAQVSVVQPSASPDAVDSGNDTALTQVYTYYPEVHETDPSTGVRWTPSGFNSMRLRLQRTA